MAQLQLTRSEAAYIATIAQGLDRRPFNRKVRKQDLLDTIERLGCVQLDTISVISRSHETVLWSRLGTYNTQHILDLYDPDLAITEYWAHAAAIIPTSMLPVFRSAMEWYRTKFELPTSPEVANAVVHHIASNGPVTSRDFDAPEDVQTHAWDWYGKKQEREALADLWSIGQIVVRKREKSFARVFDLPERVVPDLWADAGVSRNQMQQILIDKAVRALGVVTAEWVSDYFRSGRKIHMYVNEAAALLNEREACGALIPVEIQNLRGKFWLDPGRISTLDLLREGKGRPTLTTLLSPFDNLVWNRGRDLALWNFDYRLECYTPAPKRVYGYYTLPILHRGQLVGRLEPSFNRKTKQLTVRKVHFEPHVKITPPLVNAIVRSLEELVAFLGGLPGNWVVEATYPESARVLFEAENS